MATLIINGESVELEDGAKIVDAIEEAGCPIGCSNGVCGTCEIEVKEGMDNLSPLNDEERDLGMEGSKRLGCQVKLLQGSASITF